MADINDIRIAIAAALTEVGVTGHLDVTMDGAHTIAVLGSTSAHDVSVDVVITPLD